MRCVAYSVEAGVSRMIAKSIPSLFTLGSLFLGVLSIILTFNDRPDGAALLVIIAMLLDGLDGRVARALNAQSEFGKELDSLSDVIAFGVAPAFIMYQAAFVDQLRPEGLTWIATAIFPICGALRLARFNVIEGTPGYFTGLPIPAAGGVLATLALFHKDVSVYLLLIGTLVLSFLMISGIQYPSFKRIGLPKAAVWLAPVVVAAGSLLAWAFPKEIPKFILALLLVYALWGLKKNADRPLRQRAAEEDGEEPVTFKHGA